MSTTWKVFKLNTDEIATSDHEMVVLMVPCGPDFDTEQEAQHWLQTEPKGEFAILPVYRN